MDWDHLRFFLAVAEGGSLQAAARKLGVNHSTVFRRINRFEQEVRARLFERLADGYQLTTAGEELMGHVRQIGDEVDQLSLKVLGKDYRPSGKVRLTAPDNLAHRYLPGYLLEFTKRYPDIQLEIVVGAESLDLTRREADVAVRATSAPPPHLVGRKVVTVPWSYYAAKAYLKGRPRPTSVRDLAGRRLIGADGALRRLPPFRELESKHGPDIAMTCSTLDSMSAMAEAGLGIALLPDDQQKPSLVRLFETEPSYANDIWLLTHPELRRTERIRLLLEHLTISFRGDERLRPAALTSQQRDAQSVARRKPV